MKPVIKLDSKRACEENGYSASTVKFLSQRDEMRPGALSQTNRAHLVRILSALAEQYSVCTAVPQLCLSLLDDFIEPDRVSFGTVGIRYCNQPNFRSWNLRLTA